MIPLITVIITAYNVEQYIARAIESIQNQTYKNIEILIINDGSTDSTKEVCERYSSTDKRIRIINKENGGLAAARKSGVENATGDYIGFIDADDTVAIDMYELLLSNAIINDADISHCGYTMVMSDSTQKHYYNTGKKKVQNHNQGLIDLLEGKFIEPTTCTKLYKRDLFNHIKYYTDVTINEDLMLNYSLFSVSQKSIYQDVCKYYYFKYDGSMSRTISVKQFTDPVTVRERIWKLSSSESENVQSAAKSRLVSQYISNCFLIKKNKYREYDYVYRDNRNHIKKLYKTCFLTRNERIKARTILYAPWMCSVLDRLYNAIK